jgi:muramoyltetrapeptide carboxypeptidase
MLLQKPKNQTTIGVVGLSMPISFNPENQKNILQNLKNLELLGYNVVLAKTVLDSFGYKTSTIKNRINDLHQMFLNPKIDIILNTLGGYNSNELLEFIDYDLIKQNPKPFIGYSDITTVNLALYKNSDLQTINGYFIKDLHLIENWEMQIADAIFKDTFELKNQDSYKVSYSKEVFKTPKLKFLEGKKETANGKVLAGNLSTFNLLLGTDYIPNLEGHILFLEYDKEEEMAMPSLERMLWQIRQNGIFDKINGLVFGLLESQAKQQESPPQTIKQILQDVTEGYNFLVAFDAQFGHIYPSFVLKNGVNISIKNV